LIVAQKIIRSVFFVVLTMAPMNLILSSCAAPSSDTSDLSPAEQQLRAQNANYNKTILQGAGVGALAGALIGGLLMHNHAEGVALGAAAGAAVGGGAGYAVAQNNSNQAASEASYNNQISAAQASAQHYSESARLAQTVADQATAEASQLETQYASQQISVAEYHEKLQRYRQDSDVLSTTIQAAQKQESELRAAAAQSSGGESQQLTASADSIDQSQSTMLQEQQQISQVLEAAPGGTGS
jgi:hypothetical protein